MFRKFILVTLVCLNSYKTLAEDKKSEYVINNSIYVMDNNLLDIMENFKDKDSLVKNKKIYIKEDIKEKLLKPIYSEDPVLYDVELLKENQANPFPNNKNQTDLFQSDFTKLDQIRNMIKKIKASKEHATKAPG